MLQRNWGRRPRGRTDFIATPDEILSFFGRNRGK
jgi:hypothetical protein